MLAVLRPHCSPSFFSSSCDSSSNICCSVYSKCFNGRWKLITISGATKRKKWQSTESGARNTPATGGGRWASFLWNLFSIGINRLFHSTPHTLRSQVSEHQTFGMDKVTFILFISHCLLVRHRAKLCPKEKKKKKPHCAAIIDPQEVLNFQRHHTRTDYRTLPSNLSDPTTFQRFFKSETAQR